MNVSNLIIMFRAVYYILCLNRSKAISTPDVNISTDDGVHDVIYGITDDQAAEIQAQGLSKDFVQWVNQGETFWY